MHKSLRITTCLTIMLLPAIVLAQVERSPGVTSKTYTYKKTPQGELQMLVDFPPGWKASDRRPVIVFFFGGGWTGGSVKQFEPQAHYLATRGMVAARADYRVKSRHQVQPDDCVRDAQTAIRWVRKHADELGIDSERLISSGGSAGGHLAACTGTIRPLESTDEDTAVSIKPSAMVLFNPVLQFYGEERMQQRLGGDEELAKAISPTMQLSADAPPTLLLYGTDDELIKQGEAFLARGRQLGAQVEMYKAESQRHGFFNRSPWTERTLKRVDEFLAAQGYLSGKPTIEVPEEVQR